MNKGRLYIYLLPLLYSLIACSTKPSKTIHTAGNSLLPTRPNIIFIIADDLGYGDVGVYGQQKIATPQIDKMAKEGMLFTQFYAGTSVCAPSRSAFMTGQHTGHTPIRGNFEIQPEGQFPLPASAITVGEVMKQAGYVNAVFGKWGLGFIGTSGDPLLQGFDHFFGYNCQRQSHNFFPLHLWDGDNKVSLTNTFTHQVDYSADIIQQKALDFIGANAQRPFFVCLTYTLPHAGLQLPYNDSLQEKYKKQFKEQAQPVEKNWAGIGYQPQPYPKATYAAMVGRLDRYVGEVLDKIKKSGIDEKTIVLFTSDNGPHKEGGNDPEFFNSSGSLRGTKRDLYEGGIRVPFIIRWPGKVKAGTVSNHIGAFWDLLPTFAGLGGAQAPPGIDGISIAPTLLSQPGQQQHSYLYWEFHENNGRQAVRMGKWKGVKYNVKKVNSPIELYNLDVDPYEKNNVAAANPEIVHELSKIMKQAHVETDRFPLVK